MYAIQGRGIRRNPVGVSDTFDLCPGVGAVRQPWALRRNPVGIRDGKMAVFQEDAGRLCHHVRDSRRLAALSSFLMLMFLILPYQCWATKYFLDSHAGSDSADGSEKRPWRSLAPLNQATFHPGDTVFFAAGSKFEGGIEVNQSGTSNAPITFTRFGEGPAPQFTNPGARVLEGSAIRINARHILVDGLFFDRCPTNPVAIDIHQLGAVFLTTNATDCVLQNCEMTHSPVGITVYGEHNLITKNFIHDDNQPVQPHWGPICLVICGSHNEVSYNHFENYAAPSDAFGHDGGAIEINDRSLPKEDIRIHDNLSLRNQGFIEWVGRVKQDDFRIHHNITMDYQQFLGLTGPCTNFQIENNTVIRILAHDKPDSEDVVFWSYEDGGANTNIVFRNNIFVYDGSRIEPVFARGKFEHSFNLYYRTDEATIPKQANRWAYERKYLGGGAMLGIWDKIGNPMFRDMAHGDFHLKPGSPAIDAGTDLGFKRDFDGNPIPAGAAPDMGAYEFQGPR